MYRHFIFYANDFTTYLLANERYYFWYQIDFLFNHSLFELLIVSSEDRVRFQPPRSSLQGRLDDESEVFICLQAVQIWRRDWHVWQDTRVFTIVHWVHCPLLTRSPPTPETWHGSDRLTIDGKYIMLGFRFQWFIETHILLLPQLLFQQVSFVLCWLLPQKCNNSQIWLTMKYQFQFKEQGL